MPKDSESEDFRQLAKLFLILDEPERKQLLAMINDLEHEALGPAALNAAEAVLTRKRNELVHGQATKTLHAPALERMPRFWELFRFLLPEKIEREAFEPHYNDMLRDHVLAIKKWKSTGTRRCLTLFFAFRTALMVLDCFRLLAADQAFRVVAYLLPDPLKKWWRQT